MNNIPDLRDFHSVLLSILVDVDTLCKKHNIKYFLMCGSLLGAIRHNGFIPWDDDLDIGFFRADYEKFLDVAEKELDKNKYYVQREFDKNWTRTYSKIRLNGTTLIERVVFDSSVHQGMYIDLFPIDNLSENSFVRKVQWKAYKIICNKHSDMFHEKRSFIKKVKHIISCIFLDKFLLSIIRQKKNDNSKRVHMYLGGSSIKENNEFFREDFDEVIPHTFEGRDFYIPCGWDRILHTAFHDYMKFPPVEKRIARIHAEYYDLHKDYRDYLREFELKQHLK